MARTKALRLAGFIGALGVSAALIGASIAGTGAWFTDSKAGSLSANSGHLRLNIDPGTSTTLNYADLMPGTNVDKTIHYLPDVSSGGVDIWLVFDQSNDAKMTAYQQFTGGKGSSLWPDGGLGRFGFFKVSDALGGDAFVTGNLSFLDAANTTNTCPTDANGRGGSPAVSTGQTDFPPKCGVPGKILLASNLANGQDSTVTITFGLNGPLWKGQNAALATVYFNLVATQHGVAP